MYLTKNVKTVLTINGQRIKITIGTVDDSSAINEAADVIGGTVEEVLEAYEETPWFLPVYKHEQGKLVQAVAIISTDTTREEFEDIADTLLDEIVLDVIFDGDHDAYGNMKQVDCWTLCAKYETETKAAKTDLLADWDWQDSMVKFFHCSTRR